MAAARVTAFKKGSGVPMADVPSNPELANAVPRCKNADRFTWGVVR